MSVSKKYPMVFINSRVYFSHEKWERLRVLGWETRHDDFVVEANLTFTPMKQSRPAMDETTHPEMADPVMFELLSDYNTVSKHCQLGNPWYRRNMLRAEPHTLGSRIKYLLRCSNDSYPDILTDVQGSADLFVNQDEDFHNLDKYPGNADRLEIQAYDEQIVIMGGGILIPECWPAGYLVEQYGGGHSWRADDIVLPVDVSDDELGRLLLRVWAAKQYLPTPHPPEFTTFWQRIAD